MWREKKHRHPTDGLALAAVVVYCMTEDVMSITMTINHYPVFCKPNIYLILIHPLMEYGASTWDPHFKQVL